MTIRRSAQATWHGNLSNGEGSLTAPSGVLNQTPYSFKTRFGDTPGTNPEELIAAAHAGCFTMALSFALQNAGFTAEALSTQAELSLDQVPSGFTISAIHLKTSAKVPGIGADQFQEIANGAKTNCPVSKVLNCTITLDAVLI